MSAATRLITVLALLAGVLVAAGCSEEAPEPAQSVPAAEEAPAAEPPAESSVDEAATPDSPEFTIAGGSDLDPGLALAYRQHCSGSGEPSLECEVHRSLLIADVVTALEEIDKARDQRGAEEALSALDLVDEPEVLIAAMRVLGQFPDTPGIAAKAMPLLLDSPWLSVQQLAANLLERNPDPEVAGIGSLWNANHGDLYAEDEYTEYPDFAPHYLDMEFPEHPEAEWFSPADSDRSVGWWTADDAAEVSRWLSEELGVEPLGYQQWAERLAAQSTASFESIDPAKQAEVERLLEEFTKTQDVAVLERMQKLQEEMYAPMQQAGKVSEMGVDTLILPGFDGVYESVQYFIAEETDGHVSRLVLVYPLPGLDRTVIQEAWNLLDYPSAWPPAESPEG